MAGDLAATPDVRAPRPAVRRRAPVELRRLRRARPPPGLRPQRLRRDAARPLGVGRQAAGRQPRGRGPRPGLRRRADGATIVLRPRREYREAMRRFADDGPPATSGTRAWTWTTSCDGWTPSSRRRGQARARKARGEGARPRTACARVRQAHRASSTGAADHQRPPLIVPLERPASTQRGRTTGDADARLLARYRRSLARRPPLPARALPLATWRARSSGVGSVGTRAWIVLLLGRDDHDPLVLQAKEASASVLEPYLGARQFAQPGPARRRGPAADAGRQRHLPRLERP